MTLPRAFLKVWFMRTCSLLACLSGTEQLWEIFQQFVVSRHLTQLPICVFLSSWLRACSAASSSWNALKGQTALQMSCLLLVLQFTLISMVHCDIFLFSSFNMEAFARLLAEEKNWKSLGWLPCKKPPWAVAEPRMFCGMWVTAETISWSIGRHMTAMNV